MSLRASGRVLVAASALLVAGTAVARDQGRVPTAFRLAQQDDAPDAEPGGDAAGLVLRIGRLEEQVRSLTGQIEQLQFQNRRLEETLRKAQADNDFRFKDLEGAGNGAGAGTPPAARPATAPKRVDAPATSPPAVADAAPDAPPPAAGTRPATARRSAEGDAFDPASDPAAPGAPRPLGTTPPSQPLAARVPRTDGDTPRNAPLDLTRPQATASVATTGTPPADDVVAAPAATVPSPRDTTGVATLAPGGTREEYEADLGFYKQGAYDSAASGFKAFAGKYPRDRLVPDAVFLAGESYARLGRHSEAVEQFLRVFTDYGKSPRAPDALLRLGISLNAMGQKNQACATYQEVTRRYPSASADVRSAVDRELKRARCADNG